MNTSVRVYSVKPDDGAFSFFSLLLWSAGHLGEEDDEDDVDDEEGSSGDDDEEGVEGEGKISKCFAIFKSNNEQNYRI